MSSESLGTDNFLGSAGKSLQQLRPATANTLEPHSVLCLSTTSPRTADLNIERLRTAAVFTQKSAR